MKYFPPPRENWKSLMTLMTNDQMTTLMRKMSSEFLSLNTWDLRESWLTMDKSLGVVVIFHSNGTIKVYNLCKLPTMGLLSHITVPSTLYIRWTTKCVSKDVGVGCYSNAKLNSPLILILPYSSSGWFSNVYWPQQFTFLPSFEGVELEKVKVPLNVMKSTA